MKFNLYLFLVLIVSFTACKKEKQTPDIVPIADFSLVNAVKTSDGSYVAPTYVTLNTANASTNADSYSWDANGSMTSSQQKPDFRFTKTGNYIINLQTKSSTGNNASSSKSIRIVDRLLYAVQVTNPNWQSGKAVNLFVRIYSPLTDNTAPALAGNTYPTSVFYQSAVTSANYSQTSPVNISLPANPVLTPGSLLPGNPASGFTNFGYCLYSLEAGSEKLLASSWQNSSATSQIIFNDVLSNGISTLEISNQGLTASFYATNNK